LGKKFLILTLINKKKAFMNKHERFKQAILYLKGIGRISTKKSLAEAMGASASNVTTAINTGDPKVLTDQFIMRFSRAFDGVFSTEWLISGNGEMLLNGTNEEQADPNHFEDEHEMVSRLLAAKEETIEALRQQLALKDEIIQAKDQLIASLRHQIPYSTIDEPCRMAAEP
jgi:hypothetical protein